MSNDVWVLNVRSSLTTQRLEDVHTELTVYDSFDKARAAFRARLKSLAFSRNAMFDGDGHITYLKEYCTRMADDDEVNAEGNYTYDDGVLSFMMLDDIQLSLKALFAGQDTSLAIDTGDYTDWIIAVNVNDTSIRFYGDDDGPCNGYDPVLETNAFSMAQEGDYYLHIEDLFGQHFEPSVLYMDLQKATVL